MRRIALLVVGMALLAGCGDDSGTEGQDLATLRSVTAPYTTFEAGKAAEHARLGGFPADRVLEVATVIDPTTAEAHQLAA